METSSDRLLTRAASLARGGSWRRRDVPGLLRLLAGVAAAELAPDLEHRLARLPPAEVGVATWIEDELAAAPGFHASLFLVPAGAVLPLHDHPGMTVLLRVLAGRLAVRSLDWVERDAAGGGLAHLAAEREVTAVDAPLALYPDSANLHELRALEDTAFLDLFSPYYDDETRPCTYYREADPGGRGERIRLQVTSEPPERTV